MRVIKVSTDVFAHIWSRRLPNEHEEDQILRRILGIELSGESETVKEKEKSVFSSKIRWVDDVVQALANLGGRAHLGQIYKEVRQIRSTASRSVPQSIENVIRKELEIHSSDSEVFEGREDLFRMPEGKGAGVWALR